MWLVGEWPCWDRDTAENVVKDQNRQDPVACIKGIFFNAISNENSLKQWKTINFFK